MLLCSRNSIWFLSSVPAVRQFLPAVSDPVRHALVAEVLDTFCDTVLPAASQLQQGRQQADRMVLGSHDIT